MAENFVRDGRIGDEVWHPCFGNGVIQNITLRRLLIKFECGSRMFEVLGNSTGDRYAALCWGHRIMQQINQGKPPEREDD